ncbi:MAG: hypothetical protein OET63_18505 [Desulfobacterales bacterium]|nr:hypothetical protein [Desulfobacterales bacterium]
MSRIEYDIIPCKAKDFMVLKRRFGRITAGRVNFYGTLSGSVFQKTNDHQLSANSLGGCSKDELESFEKGHRDKKPVWQGI